MAHTTVLRTEAVAALDVERAGTVIDCTYGAGGHSQEILQQLPKDGHLISIDVDQTALEANPATDARHSLLCGNFKNLTQLLTEQNITSVDAILADLGWRSEQFEDGQKGFSFQVDEPLLMTFGSPEQTMFTAYDVVNDWDEENIADIIFNYGDERGARLIAAAIVYKRKEAPIKTSSELAACIIEAVGHFYKRGSIHPATKTFQAIRIVVNDELGALRALLIDGFELLAPGGRLAIISFHSLEDRMVKHTMRTFVHDHDAIAITKKPIIPSTEELVSNPKARSAKLRVIQKKS